MQSTSTLNFSATPGIQPGSEYFAAMRRPSTPNQICIFDEQEGPIEARARRALTTARIPES